MNQQAAWMPCQEEKYQKYDRTLVLTTHHLNEAEVLSDKISIMASVKLLACGKSDYIKSNFGEGHQLKYTTWNQQIKQIKDLKTELLPAINGNKIVYHFIHVV